MNYILFHIPHSSLKIPKQFFRICVKNREYIENTNLFLSDYLVDKLIPSNSHKLKFKYSRIFCDVEKFIDDKKEIMAKKGMGVIYTNDCNNLITIPDNKYKNSVIKSYYYKHHSKLDKIVSCALRRKKKCLIIDLHSYSDKLVYKLLKKDNNKDICIGTDTNYTNKELLNLTINHFKEYGYSIEINEPYSGTIIPNKYFHKNDKRLLSIMIEINKRVYLNNFDDFKKMQSCMKNYYEKLKYMDFSDNKG